MKNNTTIEYACVSTEEQARDSTLLKYKDFLLDNMLKNIVLTRKS